MAELTITIGGRDFEVVCGEGQEPYLRSAAGMLDQEAQKLDQSQGRITESRMLLMAGLMLADRTAAVEDENQDLKAKSPAPVAAPTPAPAGMSDQDRRNMDELADRALAAQKDLDTVKSELGSVTKERDMALAALERITAKIEAVAKTKTEAA